MFARFFGQLEFQALEINMNGADSRITRWRVDFLPTFLDNIHGATTGTFFPCIHKHVCV